MLGIGQLGVIRADFGSKLSTIMKDIKSLTVVGVLPYLGGFIPSHPDIFTVTMIFVIN